MFKLLISLSLAVITSIAAVPATAQSNGAMMGGQTPSVGSGTNSSTATSGATMSNDAMSNGTTAVDSDTGMMSQKSAAAKPAKQTKMRHKKPATNSPNTTPNP